MRVEVQMRDASELMELPDEDELPMMEAHHIDALTGEDDAGAEEGRLLIDMNQPRRKPVPPEAEAKATPAIDPKDPTTWGKVARNNPCPCGSGKRYKHCHGKYA
jgi:preprotein translocase subunit SecA